MRQKAALIVLWGVAACGGSSETGIGSYSDSCHGGSTPVGGICGDAGADVGPVVPLPCGSGTYPSGTTCVADPPAKGVSCGKGTHEEARVCVLDTGNTDAGIPFDGAAGVPPCGPGTHDEGGTCLPDARDGGLHCGPGTVASGDECLPNVDGGLAYYDVRVAVQQIDADGYSKVPVTVLGRLASGAPSLEPVVLSTSRLGAGTLTPLSLTLAAGGSSLFYVPCNAANSPGCLGDFRITMARASDPGTVIASSQLLSLVAPSGVGSAAACLGGGNVLFLDGEAGDYIHPGAASITEGAWTASLSTYQVHVHVDPTSQAQGLWWDVYLDSSKIGQPIAAQVYAQAERWPFQSTNKAGLDVTGDGRGCNTSTGRFQIETLETNASTLKLLTATFEQHCDGAPALHGCVHFEQ